MTETIKWSETPDKDRVRLIIKDVMGWRFYESWEAFSMEHTAGTPYSYPAAFWNDHINKWSVFYRDEENGVCFDPMHDMNDAWQVVRQVNKPSPDYQIYYDFVDNLQKIVGSDMFYDLFHCDPDGDHLTPERICIAALRAIGSVVSE